MNIDITKTNSLIFISIMYLVSIILIVYLRTSTEENSLRLLLESYIGRPEITGWRMSHLILYLIFGVIYPEYFWLFFMFGIIWEIVEFILTKVDDNWWGSSYDHILDIITNSIGFILGMLLNKHYFSK